MSKLSDAMAKLAGVQKGVKQVLDRPPPGGGGRAIGSFVSADVGHYFDQYPRLLAILREEAPNLYEDFPLADTAPSGGSFSREQLDRLFRDLTQIFEIRANSEREVLSGESAQVHRRVFISHGRSPAWREVQAYIEKDLGFATLELAQEPNRGRTIPEKLFEEAGRCDSAVIVMTAEDLVGEDQVRARENVIHEVGFFQGKYGRSKVCLLHEDGTNIPSNLSGVVYSPFPSNNVGACFGLLFRELKSIYGL